VLFKVGDIVLGKGIAGPYLNPIEITDATDIFEYKPTNIARFLQTIDDNATPSDGIQIVDSVIVAAEGKSLDFDQRPATWGDDPNVQQVISELTAKTQAGVRPLVSLLDAQNHLRSSIYAVMSGNYDGSFDYDDGPEFDGDWTMLVATDGSITMTLWPEDDEYGFDYDEEEGIIMQSTLMANGSFSMSLMGEPGLTFFGRIARRTHDGLHDVTGYWEEYMGTGNGDFYGSRPLADYPKTISCPP
jgi:hypothetical protein